MQTPAPIDLVTLEWSLILQQTGSFRGAADHLGVEQSAVSRRVRGLEDSLGVSLFQRSSRGAQPTYAGEAFLARVTIALSMLRDAAREAGFAGRGQSGRLRIGVGPSSLGPGLLCLLSRFRADHPRVWIDVVEGLHLDQLSAVRERHLDIAVVPGGARVVGLDVSRLWRERVCLVLPSANELAAHEHVSWKQLGAVRLMASGRDLGSSIDVIAARAGRSVCIERVAASSGMLLDLVRLGLGAALIQAQHVPRQPDPDLRVLPIPSTTIEEAMTEVELAWSAFNDNPVLRRFLVALRALGDEVASAELTEPGAIRHASTRSRRR